jgi:5-oxoprolinase (ATP-hydrolysing) subunit A
MPAGMRYRTDFNCDLGEGCGNDAAIMPLISSANIACGGHAGDERSMRETLRLCRQFGVAAGAHPGYPDREHFGRRALQLDTAQIAIQIIEQLQRLADLADAEAVRLRHVKPHGALYNQAARDARIAEVIANSVKQFDSQLILVGLAGSELTRAGLRAGLRVAEEAFTDRRYLVDGSLAPRGSEGAVIDDVELAVAQALSIVCDAQVGTVDGERIAMCADTLCLHGDRVDAVEFARSLRTAFDKAGIDIVRVDEIRH